MAKLSDIILPSSLKERLVQGHPWVYRTHIPDSLHLASGEWVKVRCGNWLGYGLWDKRSPIAIRIFSRLAIPDRNWFVQQLDRAWQLRSGLRQKDCTAYRWLFGEGDGLPGITIDWYAPYAVVQTYMESAATLLDPLVAAMQKVTSLQGILWRGPQGQSTETNSKVKVIWGNLPPNELIVTEYGIKFQVNLAIGQKTGLFLDHRENRCFIQSMAMDQRVLNCFAYTGAFSLYALKGGAKSVVSVDIGKGLAEATDINLHLNCLSSDRHTFITADCFEALQKFDREQTQFDLLILDPPSFAKTKQNRHAALRAYIKLNALALRCIPAGGYLVTASCTSQIGPEAFREMLAAAAALSDRHLQVIHEAGHGIDHPVPAGFPEGRYLKFIVARVVQYC